MEKMVRRDTADGRRMYRTCADEDGAAAILIRILETNEAPDMRTWEDITEQVF